MTDGQWFFDILDQDSYYTDTHTPTLPLSLLGYTNIIYYHNGCPIKRKQTKKVQILKEPGPIALDFVQTF